MDEVKNTVAVQPDAPQQPKQPQNTKFCKFCGEKIDIDCVICPKCGKQVELLKQETSQVVINNNNVNTNVNRGSGVGDNYPYKNKIVALLLAIFLGWLGIHRFYVGKIGTGIIWFFTGGLFGIGWIVDIIVIAVGSFRDKANMPLK